MQLQDRRTTKVVVARIACGRPARKGEKAPSSLDYIEITTTEKGPDGLFIVDQEAMQRLLALGPKYAEEVDDGRGGKVIKARRVPIRLTSDKVSDCIQQEYRSRVTMPMLDAEGKEKRNEAGEVLTSTRVWCHGNGREAKRTMKGGVEVTIPCRPSPSHADRPQAELVQILTRSVKHDPLTDTGRCPYAQNRNNKMGPVCKPETVGVVRSDVVNGLGTYSRFRSHGHYTADAVGASLQEIQAAIPGGVMDGVPLDLCLKMQKIATPPDGRLMPKPVLYLELRLTPEETVQLIQSNLRNRTAFIQAQAEERKLLAAAHAQVEEDEAVDGEFSTIAGSEGGGGLKV